MYFFVFSLRTTDTVHWQNKERLDAESSASKGKQGWVENSPPGYVPGVHAFSRDVSALLTYEVMNDESGPCLCDHCVNDRDAGWD